VTKAVLTGDVIEAYPFLFGSAAQAGFRELHIADA